LKAYIAFLQARASATGLAKMYGYYGDWVPPPPAGKASISFTSAWYYVMNVRIVMKIAQALGRTADYNRYSALFTQLVGEFNAAFYSANTGTYGAGLQTNLVMPLWLRELTANADIRKNVTDKLINDLTVRGNTLSTGILGTKYLVLALSDIQRTDLAIDVAATSWYPSWNWEFNNQTKEAAATTLWELWDAPDEGPGMNSRNHIMFGSVSAWFYQHLGGIRQPEWSNGYRYIIFSPPEKNAILKSGTRVNTATASLNWNVGTIKSSWKNVINTSWNHDVTLPTNTLGEVHVNCLYKDVSSCVVTESGRTVWSGGRYVGGQTGITGAMADGTSSIVFYVTSGSYSFVAQ